MPPDSPSIADYVLVSMIAGSLGAVAMYFVMRLINLAGWAKGDMLLALGSLALNRREHAFLAGTTIHWISSMIFAALYLAVLSNTGFLELPAALAGGVFLGGFQGFFVAIALVWIASDRHPLPEFQGATIPIGVMHFAGHVVYGAVVGLTIGIWASR
jgi:hypothetical protein